MRIFAILSLKRISVCLPYLMVMVDSNVQSSAKSISNPNSKNRRHSRQEKISQRLSRILSSVWTRCWCRPKEWRQWFKFQKNTLIKLHQWKELLDSMLTVSLTIVCIFNLILNIFCFRECTCLDKVELTLIRNDGGQRMYCQCSHDY